MLILRKLAKVEKKVDHLAELLEARKNDDEHEEDLMFKGINVKRIHAANPNAYGLQLMDVLFTKEELSSSLMFQSGKVPSLL